MFTSLWIRRNTGKRPAVRTRTPRQRPRLRLELLEDRCLPSAGTLDPTFKGTGKQDLAFQAGEATGTAVAVQPDGKVVIAGTLQLTGSTGAADFAVARFNADGSLDTGFGTGGQV